MKNKFSRILLAISIVLMANMTYVASAQENTRSASRDTRANSNGQSRTNEANKKTPTQADANGLPDPGGDPGTVPIDGGIGFLAAAGAIFGAKKLRDARKNKVSNVLTLQ